MLSFLPAPLLFLLNFTLISVVTVVLAIPVFTLALVRLLLPFKVVLALVDKVNQAVFYLWVSNNSFLMWLTNRIKWDIQGADIKKIQGSCFIISNHVTWTDIVMLGHIYRGKIPITKFFLKHSLIYIPILGQACYSLGMPFLRRYSRNELLKNPQLKMKDINATRKACLNLLEHPSSLVNFVEGTRYTPQKAAAQKSPYRHLMPPKAASLAIALGLIGEHIDCMLNTTLIYPGKHEGSIFMQMLCGRLKHVIARVEVIDKETIAKHMVGDYLYDKQFKHAFTMYLRDMWQRKDEQIEALLHGTDTATEASVTGSNSDVANAVTANVETDAPSETMVATAAKPAEAMGTEQAESAVATATDADTTDTANERSTDTEKSAPIAANTDSTQPTLSAERDIKTA
ncbi:MAG: 1-acyl-sn-glycerol-3-phosphate acyltransferase [Candidatus Anaerobiospirillum pullicola]|uniref:1-acyl-sn-glycerol-3-phosphate acyltransferase n=1 Tax=Candidatus Anaerobiospirillum pullicola TaxID=2838451 RepID=A0A948TEU9_9GAMM|nr:1-acyl-sn-glycerol-3-phosphate acyltransferase [Candidatus Anaerobiospirillum pullicola]